MDKCKCYNAYIENVPLDYKNIRTTQRIVGLCFGTKNREKCSCQGDRSKCDFYDYIRERAKKEQLDYKITQAIDLLVDNGYEVKKR